jgi:beta-lactamase regulating signal transducer with metallopeptidase domain
MMLLQLDYLAQASVARIVNSLPEGILVALFAWLVLRLLPRQNSGTRFAVWFVALLTIAGLPLIGIFGKAHAFRAQASVTPVVTLSSHWALLLFTAWALAACVAFLHLASALWRLRQLRKSCVLIDPAELDPAIRKIAADFSTSRSVTLATSENLRVPAVIGFFQPIIVIPRWALRELCAEEFSIILLHEFAHLRRRDDWTNLLQKLVRAVFLFHPAVWWIERQLCLEREMACDDHVLAETGNPRAYAKCLVSLLERSFARRALVMAQAAVNRAREASLRVARILDLQGTSSKQVQKATLGLVSAFAALCLVVVPSTPRLVAFGPSAPASDHPESGPRLAFARESQLPAAQIVPAGLRLGSSSADRSQERRAVAPIRHRDRNRSTNANVIAARSAETQARAAISAVKVSQTLAPATETVLVIRTTTQVGPNAYTWQVRVWRVMLVPDHANRVPAAKNT